jgi:hypothetical protein
MKRGGYAKWIAYLGFATAARDIIGSYPWAIGPVLTLICQLSFGGWFVAVGVGTVQNARQCRLKPRRR